MSLDFEVLQNNGISVWGIALVSSFLLFLCLEIARRVIRNRLAATADQRGAPPIAEFTSALFSATKPFFTLFLALFVATRLLYLTDYESHYFLLFFSIALAFQTGIWGNTVINYYISHPEGLHLAKRGVPKSALNVFGIIAKTVLWAFILLFLLDNLEFDVAALLTGLGIGGIAVAFAVQNILKDILASLSILMDKPFVVGDLIFVGDLAGNVEKIGIKTTRLRSINGELLIFGNSDLLNSRIRNMKRMQKRRVVFSLNFVYQTPHEKLLTIPSIVKEMIDTVDQVEFNRAHFSGFGDSSLDFEVAYYVLDRDFIVHMDKKQQIFFKIHERCAREGLQFAYPTQTLYIEQGCSS